MVNSISDSELETGEWEEEGDHGGSRSSSSGAAPLPLRLEADKGEDTLFSLVNLMVLVGMKGSTKTTNLVRFGLKALIEWKRPVFSDFPFSADICGQHYEPEPMPEDIFVTYGHGLPRNAVILTDELQEFFDRQNWSSVESKLGVSVFQQIRKLGFLLVGATQFFSYLNTRINEQVDILVRCKDMRLTPWGINEGIKRGREALLEYYDLCGAFDVRGSARNRGNPHFVTGEPFFEELVFTEPFWRFFDSKRMTAIEHRFRRYTIQKEQIPVRLGQGNDHKKAAAKEAISDLLRSLNRIEQKEIKAGEFHKMLLANGTDINIRTQGEIIREIGIKVIKRCGNSLYQLQEE